MNKRYALLALTGCLLSAPATLVRANEGHMKGAGHGGDAREWQKELGLTEDQVTKLNAAKAAAQADLKTLGDKHQELMKKLQDQVNAKATDSDIKVTLDDLKNVHKDTDDREEKLWSEKGDILTPTQLAKMKLKKHAMMKGAAGGPKKAMRGSRRSAPGQIISGSLENTEMKGQSKGGNEAMPTPDNQTK